MRKHNWDSIEAKTGGFDSPAPGAYLAVITGVEDKEEKEYLKIEWDFSEGAYKGNNRDTFDRAGFWPITLYKSYKESVIGYFKAFKTALEESNPGYTFREDELRDMVGRRMGVVLGEEEYSKKNGTKGTRLYVFQVRSLEAIQRGDFTIPEKKRLASAINPTHYSAPSFSAMDDNDDELPF